MELNDKEGKTRIQLASVDEKYLPILQLYDGAEKAAWQPSSLTVSKEALEQKGVTIKELMEKE